MDVPDPKHCGFPPDRLIARMLTEESLSRSEKESMVLGALKIDPGHAWANFLYAIRREMSGHSDCETYYLRAANAHPRFAVEAMESLQRWFKERGDVNRAAHYMKLLTVAQHRAEARKSLMHSRQDWSKNVAIPVGRANEERVANTFAPTAVTTVYALRYFSPDRDLWDDSFYVVGNWKGDEDLVKATFSAMDVIVFFTPFRVVAVGGGDLYTEISKRPDAVVWQRDQK